MPFKSTLSLSLARCPLLSHTVPVVCVSICDWWPGAGAPMLIGRVSSSLVSELTITYKRTATMTATGGSRSPVITTGRVINKICLFPPSLTHADWNKQRGEKNCHRRTPRRAVLSLQMVSITGPFSPLRRKIAQKHLKFFATKESIGEKKKVKIILLSLKLNKK